jgi:hypothetical protein
MLLAAEQAVKSNPSGIVTIAWCAGAVIAFLYGLDESKPWATILGVAMWVPVLLRVWKVI